MGAPRFRFVCAGVVAGANGGASHPSEGKAPTLVPGGEEDDFGGISIRRGGSRRGVVWVVAHRDNRTDRAIVSPRGKPVTSAFPGWT